MEFEPGGGHMGPQSGDGCWGELGALLPLTEEARSRRHPGSFLLPQSQQLEQLAGAHVAPPLRVLPPHPPEHHLLSSLGRERHP